MISTVVSGINNLIRKGFRGLARGGRACKPHKEDYIRPTFSPVWVGSNAFKVGLNATAVGWEAKRSRAKCEAIKRVQNLAET